MSTWRSNAWLGGLGAGLAGLAALGSDRLVALALALYVRLPMLEPVFRADHERQIRALQSRPRPVNVLTTHSSWLFSSLVLGCKGLLSGSGSVIAGLQAELWRAVQANDLATAKALHERIYPTAEAFYADPFVDMHNRMKEALVLLGRLPRAVVRPPLVKLPAEEIERIRRALIAAGLLDVEGRRKAA